MTKSKIILIAIILAVVVVVFRITATPDNVGFVNNCVVIGEGADEDCPLIRVNVTGMPMFRWDEGTDAFVMSHALDIRGIGDGELTSYDLKVGDTLTPDYGMIQMGNAVIGRTSFKNANMDADGTVIFRNLGGPVTGKIEFLWSESAGNTTRFAIPASGVGNATYNPRSMLMAGPAPADTDMVTVGYWQANNGIFDNLACDTSGVGADLGVQNDLEVERDIYTDSIKESTPGAGVAFDAMIIPSGTTPAPDTVGAIFLDTDESVNGSLMMYGNGAWRKVADL